MAGLISKLFIQLTADTTKFQTGMSKAGRSLTQTQTRVAAASKAFRGLAGALGATIGISALTRLGNSAIQLGSKITDMAIATNVGVEQLQALQFAAQEAGATNEQMANLLVRVQKSASDAARGLSTARDAFAKLNINTATFLKLSPEAMLERVGRSLVAAEGDVTAYGAALDILGTRNAPKLMEVMKRLGVDGFAAVAKEARDAGQVMDEDTAQRLDKAADHIERFKTANVIKIGEAIAFWARLSERIIDVNKELEAITSMSGGAGIMAQFVPKIEALRSEEQRIKMLEEMRERMSAVNSELATGDFNRRTGTGFFTVEMEERLRAAQTSYALLIRNLDGMAGTLRSNKEIMESSVPAYTDMDGAIRSVYQSTLTASQHADLFTSSMVAMGLESTNLTAGLEGVKQASEKMAPTILNATDQIKTGLERATEYATGFSDAIVDGLSSAAMDGKTAMADMFRYIIAQIQKMMIKWLLFKSITGIGGMMSGNIGSAVTSFGSSFGPDGTRASGGPVAAGRSYLVGERGPEIVSMGSSGHVTPNGKLGGDTYNIDARNADAAGLQRLEMMIQKLSGTVERRAIAAVSNISGRVPGAFARA